MESGKTNTSALSEQIVELVEKYPSLGFAAGVLFAVEPYYSKKNYKINKVLLQQNAALQLQFDKLQHDTSKELRDFRSDLLEALRTETAVREQAMTELYRAIEIHDAERREETRKNIEVMDAMIQTMKKMSEDLDKRSGCSGSGPSGNNLTLYISTLLILLHVFSTL